ncbi:unnamed protein product [Miscanthus lutarioriparius]|uniref:Uncharacterized protein n=1 Tax=Miscanthus lutarioriparius TaxID=422564 RepID=A0A811PMT8_9POAL|nr:unnamed protein product [Miscanthus lutarioriparius]
MNPNSKLILDKMHRLFAEQKTSFDVRFTEADQKLNSRFGDSDRALEKRFTEVEESVTKRFTDLDNSLTKRLADSDLNWERRITDSEVCQTTLITVSEQRQEAFVSAVAKSTGNLESWRQESEGAVDDLKLKMSKLTKYMDRSVLDNPSASSGLISWSPPVMEPAAARSPAGITAARSSHYSKLDVIAPSEPNVSCPRRLRHHIAAPFHPPPPQLTWSH